MFYLKYALFRAKEYFSDLRAVGITYFLYAFFILILSHVWQRFNSHRSILSFEQVFLYIGITEMLFMSFLNLGNINHGLEDFSLFLARPRSWMGRELLGNMGKCFAERICFFVTLVVVSFLAGNFPHDPGGFFLRTTCMVLLLSVPQSLLTGLFSALRLSFPQTEYFVYPVGKIFLALGGVFGPISDYGEPWRSIFLKMPGADLFFQPAFFIVTGEFYELSFMSWLVRYLLIVGVLGLAVMSAYRHGRERHLAWGG